MRTRKKHFNKMISNIVHGFCSYDKMDEVIQRLVRMSMFNAIYFGILNEMMISYN